MKPLLLVLLLAVTAQADALTDYLDRTYPSSNGRPWIVVTNLPWSMTVLVHFPNPPLFDTQGPWVGTNVYTNVYEIRIGEEPFPAMRYFSKPEPPPLSFKIAIGALCAAPFFALVAVILMAKASKEGKK